MFPGQRHSLDTTERPTIDYGRDGATWEQSGETDAPKGHRSLKERCNQLKQYEVAYTSVMVFMIRRIVKSSATFSYRKLHREYDNRGIYEDAC